LIVAGAVALGLAMLALHLVSEGALIEGMLDGATQESPHDDLH